MRYILQTTRVPFGADPDSNPWEATPYEFNSKLSAKDHFDRICDTEGLDWRIGFLCRMRDGKLFRVVHVKTGQELKS